MKPLIFTVTNDIIHDRRIYRITSTLINLGMPVLVVGRRLRGSPSCKELPFRTYRFRMLIRRGILFYFFFNLRLFFFLLFRRARLLVANDLDTLPSVFLVSKLRGLPLVYDTHELFTEVPELLDHPGKKAVWEQMEKMIFPHLKHIMTVNSSIARIYEEKYGKPLTVVRNIANRLHPVPMERNKIPGLNNRKLIVLQGTGINTGRGAEEAVRAMQFLNDALLLIIGQGNAIPALKKIVREKHLDDQVRFIPTLPYEELMGYTAAGDAGLILGRSHYLNFRYSLPNKLFDFIQAGIPVLASDLPEVREIVIKYDIGLIAESLEPQQLAEQLKKILQDSEAQTRWRANARKAAKVLNWEKEEQVLIEFYGRIIPELVG